MSDPVPVYFISHGAPTLVTEPSAARRFLEAHAAELPAARALVVVSAHWETEQVRVGASARPRTLHDFGRGFGPELFAKSYPAQGDPGLAHEVSELLRAAGLPATLDPERGLDHGVWTPLMLLRPRADLPVVPVSIQPEQGVEGALRLGRALATLRERGVLIVTSGALTHNLREVDWNGGDGRAPFAAEFADWIADRIAAGDLDSLRRYRELAPSAVRNHPTDEHLLPLYVAVGAAGLDGAERLHESFSYGSLAMDVYRFGAQSRLAQNRWMREQASSSTSVEVA
jgi:4,5-DOPA dioxygenase extradiol